MPTITEQLQLGRNQGGMATVVLRSGKTISGEVDEIDLANGVVTLDGWTIRVDEIAGTRLGNGVS